VVILSFDDSGTRFSMSLRFGANLRAFALYLRFAQAIPFERLARLRVLAKRDFGSLTDVVRSVRGRAAPAILHRHALHPPR
jgi:hypothetical protein